MSGQECCEKPIEVCVVGHKVAFSGLKSDFVSHFSTHQLCFNEIACFVVTRVECIPDCERTRGFNKKQLAMAIIYELFQRDIIKGCAPDDSSYNIIVLESVKAEDTIDFICRVANNPNKVQAGKFTRKYAHSPAAAKKCKDKKKKGRTLFGFIPRDCSDDDSSIQETRKKKNCDELKEKGVSVEGRRVAADGESCTGTEYTEAKSSCRGDDSADSCEEDETSSSEESED